MPRLLRPLPESRYTILVVDDDEAVLTTTARLLSLEGHQVLTAQDGYRALELCQAHTVQLMLLDYSMPGLNGEEVVRRVRVFNRDMQIVLQTGYTEKPARQMLRDLEIQGYHDKSFGPERLLLWVDVALKSYEQAKAKESLEGSLLALGLALEARDLETAGHTLRVVELSEQLGRAVALTNKQLSALRQGAYLHDLGKLSIPDAILLKPGPLEPTEWEMMKTHAEKGFALAKLIPGLAPEALEVIRHHHEAWDGRGYPLGLHGEAIPLLAQIFSLCDVFDALVSERPYKRAWSVEAALVELDRQRGKQFNSELTDIFGELVKSRMAAEQTLAPTKASEVDVWHA